MRFKLHAALNEFETNRSPLKVSLQSALILHSSVIAVHIVTTDTTSTTAITITDTTPLLTVAGITT